MENSTLVEYLKSILDRLHAAIFLADRGRHMLWCNAQGHELLGADDGVSLSRKCLHFWHADESREFAIAVAAAAVSDAEATVSSFKVTRPSGRRDYNALVLPLSRPEDSEHPLAASEEDRAVLIAISDPELVARHSPDHIARLFGLTSAESRLAAAVAAGESLTNYSSNAGISVGTARWTLKQVLEKTGCRKQSELVYLVLTAFAGFEPFLG